jgi:hypothetical protein
MLKCFFCPGRSSGPEARRRHPASTGLRRGCTRPEDGSQHVDFFSSLRRTRCSVRREETAMPDDVKTLHHDHRLECLRHAPRHSAEHAAEPRRLSDEFPPSPATGEVPSTLDTCGPTSRVRGADLASLRTGPNRVRGRGPPPTEDPSASLSPIAIDSSGILCVFLSAHMPP